MGRTESRPLVFTLAKLLVRRKSVYVTLSSLVSLVKSRIAGLSLFYQLNLAVRYEY